MTEIVPTGMTVKTARDNLTGILSKIRKLLDQANHEGTNPDEAASFRAHAERLMAKYHLDEEAIIAADPGSIEPIRQTIELAGWASQEFASQYTGLFYSIAVHTGIRARYMWIANKTGAYILVADAVGYESDLRYAEMLFTEARLVFQEHLEPTVKPELSVAENVYRLRSSGMNRQRIAELVFGKQGHNEGIKVGKLYKEECERRGEDPVVSGRSINAKTYREIFAQKFVARFAARLRKARDAAEGGSGALELHGRKERVDEAFYTTFPETRPRTDLAAKEECAACKKAKSGHCREHPKMTWTKADDARWERNNYSSTALAAQAAGSTAADAVPLRGVGSRKQIGEDSTRTALRDMTGLEIGS